MGWKATAFGIFVPELIRAQTFVSGAGRRLPLNSAGCATARDSVSGTTSGSNNLGNIAAAVWGAFGFTAGASYTLCKNVCRMDKVGAPTFTLNYFVYTSSSGVPGTVIGTGASAFSVSGLTGSEGDASFVNSSAAVTNTTTYFHVFQTVGSPLDSTNYVRFYYINGGAGDAYFISTNGTTWVNANAFEKDKFQTYSS